MEEDMSDLIQRIYDDVVAGDQGGVEVGVIEALAEGLAARTILQEGLVDAMDEVGELFENGEYYIPDMVIAARAMKAGLAILKPQLVEGGVNPVGTIVLGTVKGDLHDIGKNLVGMMMEGAGFSVIDVGTDVSSEQFAEAIEEHQPQIVGFSALLTTTMMNMGTTIKDLEKAGLRERVKIIVGGAPLSQKFADEIGADGYARDAGQAVTLAKSLL
jgi:5-methyltetrahydrofolate--homocysteine methyltransferase